MTKTAIKRLLWLALPLTFAAACAHTERDASTADSHYSNIMAPTSDRSSPRVYANDADITTPPPGADPADWRLAEEVRMMLTTNKTMAPVGAVVNKGTVTLRGYVRTKGERDKVRQEVAALPNVQRVDDQLEVKNSAGQFYKGESQSY